MGHDRIDSHWRQPPDEDLTAWIRELRNRSHDFANWAQRVEGQVLKVDKRLDELGTADDIADRVQEKLTHQMSALIGWLPKLVGISVAAMTLVTMVRTLG